MEDRELKYKNLVRQALLGQGYDVQRHEDKYERFIPDLSFAVDGVDGWVEVKYLKNSIQSSAFKIDHYTAGQRGWLISRAKLGAGACFLLVGWPDGYALWRAPHLPPTDKAVSWREILAYAVANCPASPTSLAELGRDIGSLVLLRPRRR